MSSLEQAIVIATNAHKGKKDKGDAPYILHPLRVMLRVKTNEERIVGVLHDVVEDSGVTLDDLRNEGFSEEVIQAIDSVTKREGEDYDDFIQRAEANPIGRIVKLADLEDNSNLARIQTPIADDYYRVEKYRRAIIQMNLDPKPRVRIAKLQEIFEACWSKKSSKCWSKNNPASGQNAVTALVAKDVLGGEILKTPFGQWWHFYNRLSYGWIDFTSAELKGFDISYLGHRATRQEIFERTTGQEYQYLKTAVFKAIRELKKKAEST